ncbi:MAG: hypothetical protein KGR26_08495, partial [Cyanobacteria bacterium REEB65]|nr:hypothetical protein [Cyanobacteria bacterium REEB65]
PPPDHPLASTAETTDVTLQPGFSFSPTNYAILAVAKADAPISSGLRVFAQLQGSVYPKAAFDSPLGAMYTSGWMAPNLPAVFDVGFNGNAARIGGEVAYEIAGGYGLFKLRGGFAQNRFPELVGTIEANLPWWDLSVGGGWGTYELGDWGPFATLTRTFPRSQFSLGVYDSNFGVQFRGTLAIDFGPDPRPKPAVFRLIPFGPMQQEYDATAYQAAHLIAPGPDVEAFLDRMTPAYVQAHLDHLPWPDQMNSHF